MSMLEANTRLVKQHEERQQRYSQMLLCGVTTESFDRGPPEGPRDAFGTGNDGPALSEWCESAISNLSFQFWIIADADLGLGITRSNCEFAEDFSATESDEPGNFGGTGGGGGGCEWISGKGLEIRAVFSTFVLAASSATCLSVFCCLRILSTIATVSAALLASWSTHRRIHVV
jgi:hypothetical protein